MAQFILLSGAPVVAATDHYRSIGEAGFIVQPHVLGSTPPVDFSSVAAAVIDVGEKTDAAAAQTRRWRAELGDEAVPILWLLPEASEAAIVRGLEAGADGVLAQPVADGVLIAQLRTAARARAAGCRLAARASEARLLGEQLQRAFTQLDREREAARQIQKACLPRTIPALGAARAAVSYRPRSRWGGDLYDVRIVDDHHMGIWLGDVIGGGPAASLVGLFVAQKVAFVNREAGGIASPGDVLSQANRDLLQFRLDERPLVALLAATLNTATGELKLARAGLPAPIHLSAGGEAAFLAIPGPFLGTAEATYPTLSTILRPGDKLVLCTDGARIESDPAPGEFIHLRQAVLRHRARVGQDFVDAVAIEVLAQVRHEDDVTLMVVEGKEG